MPNIIQRKLFGLWSILACISGITYLRLNRTELPILVLPALITQVDVIRADTTLTFNAKPNWQLDDKSAVKFGQWLSLLPQACHRAYPSKDIKTDDNSAIITLRFNHQDEWQFSTHNPYNHSHYLIHNDTAYLCDERLKPRLTLPASYWQE